MTTYLVAGACGFIGSNDPAAFMRDWLPSVDFEAGLAETAEWYVADEPWWRDVFDHAGELQTDWA